MKKLFVGLVLLGMSFACTCATAETIAYWRFEGGVAGENIVHTGDEGVYYPDILDVTGRGNDLSVWMTGGGGGYAYNADVAYSTVSVTNVDNDLCALTTGDGPCMWVHTDEMTNWTPKEFTIEVTFKIRGAGYQTFLGRDSYGTTGNADLAAVYFQTIPDDGLAFKFCDVEGNWHDASSPTGTLVHYTTDGVNPEDVPWYSAAAVSDGTTLSLYLLNHDDLASGYQLVASADLSGSEDSTMTAGAGDGDDWDAGDWSVGRGMYAQGHADRAIGYLDEIRFSDVALDEKYFINSPYVPVLSGFDVELTPDVESQIVTADMSWTAAMDETGVVIANITDQLVFMNNMGASDGDANYVYVGAAGDPGTVAASSFTYDVDFDRYYDVVVVDIIAGQAPTAALVEKVTSLDVVDPNNIFSQGWGFQSTYSTPEITLQPLDEVKGFNETATFVVAATSITPETYTWYKAVDPENIDPATDPAQGTGTILEVAVGEDNTKAGFYYCSVTNTGNGSKETNLAELIIKDIVAHYAFDGNLTDSVGGNNGVVGTIGEDEEAVAAGTPVYVTEGYNGQSISFDGLTQQAEITNIYTKSLTMAFWIKTTFAGTDGGGWYNGDGLIDGEMPGTDNDFGAALMGDNFGFGVGGVARNDITLVSDAVVTDGQWHWCVATRDHVSGDLAIYVDGVQEGARNGVVVKGVKDAPEVLTIGSLQTDINFFKGELDDLMIYNYPMTEMEVAGEYYGMTGTRVCLTSKKPSANYDYNDDCKVDVLDFASFADVWLDCAIYPSTDCFPVDGE